MSYRIVGIDVHKKMLAVVVTDVSISGEYQFERRKYGAQPRDLRELAEWLNEQEVEEVVMESTAQYWRPVWQALERYWQGECQKRDASLGMGRLHLAQAESNRARRGRKNDFDDAERLVKRLVAQELILSYVPDAEQRLWRAISRRKYQLTKDQTRLRNQLEGLLEETDIKLTSLVSDLFGVSGRRMLKALAEGETDPAAIAGLAHYYLRATQEQLRDAVGACTQMHSEYRELLKLALEQLKLTEEQIDTLNRKLANMLEAHHGAVKRLAAVPGLGVDSAQQIITQLGPTAATFPTAKDLTSWVGVCPGQNISAEQNKSERPAKGNCTMRRVLNQAANAAVRMKGSVFEIEYRRSVSRMGHSMVIGKTAHKLCRLIWIILHKKVEYEERGPSVAARSAQARASKLIRELKRMGYTVEGPKAEAAGAR